MVDVTDSKSLHNYRFRRHNDVLALDVDPLPDYPLAGGDRPSSLIRIRVARPSANEQYNPFFWRVGQTSRELT
jgi:hypothetical protein